ncbi:MAG: hypothetical protein JXR12_06480 [Neptunomonas phycophila]|uniref:hypothetical protein n=1 Tax=Neptunomonas phycophila TaxID=1572645 RepID=UPI003B8BD6C6
MTATAIIGLRDLIKVGSKLKMKRFDSGSGDYEKRVILEVEPRGFVVSKEDVVHSAELAKFDPENEDFVAGHTYLYRLRGREHLVRL